MTKNKERVSITQEHLINEEGRKTLRAHLMYIDGTPKLCDACDEEVKCASVNTIGNEVMVICQACLQQMVDAFNEIKFDAFNEIKSCTLFLDIDGVLNDHSAADLYGPNSILPRCVELINDVFSETNCDVVVISNRAQSMGIDRLKEYLKERGVKTEYIIDAIQPVPLDNTGLVLGIEKDKFIINYIAKNNITNYVVIDDNLPTDLIQRNKIVSPSTYVGMTEKEKNQLLEILKDK